MRFMSREVRRLSTMLKTRGPLLPCFRWCTYRCFADCRMPEIPSLENGSGIHIATAAPKTNTSMQTQGRKTTAQGCKLQRAR
jgi:hypothetical protein